MLVIYAVLTEQNIVKMFMAALIPGILAAAGYVITVSLFVRCATQEEVDRYWQALLDGGQAQRCGWLRDRFGLSWQIVPERLGELLSDPDPARTQRVMQSLLQMDKLDIATLENAHEYA